MKACRRRLVCSTFKVFLHLFFGKNLLGEGINVLKVQDGRNAEKKHYFK